MERSMARLSGPNAGGRRTLDVLHPARDLGAHGRPWRLRPGPSWQDGGQDRQIAAVVSPRKFQSTIGMSHRGSGCSPPMSDDHVRVGSNSPTWCPVGGELTPRWLLCRSDAGYKQWP